MRTREDRVAEIPYRRLDRLIHGIAFGSLDLQKALADVETRLFRNRIDPRHAARPVFVTSLPRAGTTVLLNVLAGLPEFGAATYRHMPFTLVPLLWSEVTRRLQRRAKVGERAHGDGIAIGFDSPEAFEEMLWMAFWPEHYDSAAIQPWTREIENPDFELFFRAHVAKVVAAGGGGARRYLSKNNVNIARLELLERLFPDATIIIPIRDPWSQTASLLRQHLRFCELHAREPFAQRYMEGIGHFDFGAALKPIAFGAQPADCAAADQPEFWLRYWADAYEAVLATAGETVVFVDHDALSAAPEEHLPPLGEALGLENPAEFQAAAGGFRPSRPVAPPPAPPGLLARAAEIHRALRSRCLPNNPTDDAATH
jgi:hypothetical protein